MSTRSNICIVLKKEDIGKTMRFDKDKMPTDATCCTKCLDAIPSVTLEKPILQIYCHSDGYPSGVGRGLLNAYKSYDSVLNMLLGGDITSVSSMGDVCHYQAASEYEKWEWNMPSQFDEPQLGEEYIYKFEDNTWFFKKTEEGEWLNLSAYLSNYKN